MTVRTLVRAFPRHPVSGVITEVRLGGGGAGPLYHNGEHWRAGLVGLPRFSAQLAFDESGWTGGSVPQTGTLVFKPPQKSLTAQLAALYWPGASIRVDAWDAKLAVFTRRLTGSVANVAVQNGGLVITAADLSVGIDRPLLGARFAGSGGVEGVAEAAGRIKRRSWGRVFNVEGKILDKANSIYEFGDPAFAFESFLTVRDKGRAATAGPVVGWQGSIAGTFAALQAAAAPQGGYASAPSIACIKWWTTPAGPLTADVAGQAASGAANPSAPQIAAAVLQAVGGPAMAAGAVEGAHAARPYLAGLHVDQENETAAQAIDRLLLGVSLLWVLDRNGQVTIREIGFANPAESLRSVAVTRVRNLPPTRSRRLGYQRNQRQHSAGEIALSLTEGAAAVEAKLSRPSASIAAAADGSVVAGDLAELGGRFVLRVGGVDVSSQAVFDVVADNGCDPVIDAAGTYRPRAALYDTNTATFRATYEGLEFKLDYSLAKSRRGATGGQGAPGASTFTLVNIANMVFPTPNTVAKTLASSLWDAKARTGEAYINGATISADVPPGSGIGLTTDPAANASYDTVDYWFHVSTDGNTSVWRNGVPVSVGPNAPGRLTVENDGKTVRYLRAGQLLHSHAVNAPNEALYGVINIADASFHVTNIAFGSAGAAGNDGQSVVIQGSADGSSWHVGLQAGDVYMRVSNDSGATFGPAVLIKGEAGQNGNTDYDSFIFRISPTQPATPASNTGDPPPGWTDAPTATSGTQIEWWSTARFRAGAGQLGPWSAPARVTGQAGADGLTPVVAKATPSSKQFNADYNGTIKAGQLPFGVGVTGSKSGAAIGGTVAIVGTPVGCTASLVSGGFQIDSISGDTLSVKWRFTASDGQIVEDTFTGSRVKDPAPPLSTSGLNFTGASWIGTSGYATSGPATVLQAGPSGTIQLSYYAEWYATIVNRAGSYALTAKLQWRPIGGGTWFDVPGSATSGEAWNVSEPGTPTEVNAGYVGTTVNLGGLTPTSSYEFQVVGVKISGGSISSMSGNIWAGQV